MPSSTRIPNWRVIAASAQGSSHEVANLPCQDAHRWKILDDGWLVAVVADGAGSAKFAEVGAAIAVETAVCAVADRLPGHLEKLGSNQDAWRDFMTGVMQACTEAVAAEAARKETVPRQLACTLLIAVLGPSMTVVSQIGDGAVVFQGQSEAIRALTRPLTSEYINETVFLVSRNAARDMTIEIAPEPARYLAMFSDGLETLALAHPSWEPHTPFFTKLFGYMAEQENAEASSEELKSYLASPLIREYSADDVTLLVVEDKQ